MLEKSMLGKTMLEKSMLNKVILKNIKLWLLVIVTLGTNLIAANQMSYSADTTAVSNYVFRGQTLSDDAPALQAGFYAANDKGWTYRFWASSYDMNGDTDGKLEASLNYRGEVDKYFNVMFGTKYYGYESDNTQESIEWHFGLEAFDVSAVYHRNEELDTEYMEFGYFWQFNRQWRIDAHYGIAKPIYSKETGDDYSVSGNYSFNKDFNVFVTLGSHNRHEDYALAGVTYNIW